MSGSQQPWSVPAGGAEPLVAVSVPEFLVHAIGVYRSNPDRQQAIGTVDELNRLRGEWAETTVR